MGLFDLPAPLLAWMDRGLGAALSPIARILLWAMLSSGAAMGVYWLLSAQREVADLKLRIAGARREILTYDGDFAGVVPLLGRSIRLSARRVAISLGPSVVASLPVLVVVAWLSNVYAFRLPESAEVVPVHVMPAGQEVRWRKPMRPVAAVGSLAPPRFELDLVDAQGTRLLSLPLDHAVPVIHKRVWWNLLFGNPLGYLPETTSVERVAIQLPRAHYLGFGPTWLSRWETIYFASMIALSLAIKATFRIQ